jgi:hypothetical protein
MFLINIVVGAAVRCVRPLPGWFPAAVRPGRQCAYQWSTCSTSASGRRAARRKVSPV